MRGTDRAPPKKKCNSLYLKAIKHLHTAGKPVRQAACCSVILKYQSQKTAKDGSYVILLRLNIPTICTSLWKTWLGECCCDFWSTVCMFLDGGYVQQFFFCRFSVKLLNALKVCVHTVAHNDVRAQQNILFNSFTYSTCFSFFTFGVGHRRKSHLQAKTKVQRLVILFMA